MKVINASVSHNNERDWEKAVLSTWFAFAPIFRKLVDYALYSVIIALGRTGYWGNKTNILGMKRLLPLCAPRHTCLCVIDLGIRARPAVSPADLNLWSQRKINIIKTVVSGLLRQ
jgi:hypothetical protein